jgi:arylsulfatase A-like enzyme
VNPFDCKLCILLVLFVTRLFADSVAIGGELSAPFLEDQHPNIVFLLADDLGYGDVGCYGAKDIRTPNIDRLANEGTRFTQFYSNGAECSPTRAGFLTGRYQQRIGGLDGAIGIGGVGRYDDAIRLAKNKELGLPTTLPTISRALQQAGYDTAIVGKWHLGYEESFSPNRHGFDHAFYVSGGAVDYFHHVEPPPDFTPALFRNGQPVRQTRYLTDWLADEASEWLIRRHRSSSQKPFFLYVPFTAPHSPYQGPMDSLTAPLDAKSDLWQQGRSTPPLYASMIESMDQAIGRILTTIEDLGQSERTLVVFTSDNGGTGSSQKTSFRRRTS